MSLPVVSSSEPEECFVVAQALDAIVNDFPADHTGHYVPHTLGYGVVSSGEPSTISSQ